MLVLRLIVLYSQCVKFVYFVHRYFPRDMTQCLDSVNPLTPNDTYSVRTAPLTSKVAYYIFIQQI